MTVVFRSVFENEAMIVESILRSAGIETRLLRPGMPDLVPIFSTAISGFSVVVPPGQEVEARAILQAHPLEG